MPDPIDVTASADTFVFKMNINTTFEEYRSPHEEKMLQMMGVERENKEYILTPIKFSLCNGLEPVDVVVRMEVTARMPKVEDSDA